MRRVFLPLIILCWAHVLWGAPLSLYDTTLCTTSDHANLWNKHLKQGFENLITKVSGQNDPPTHDIPNTLILENMLDHFHYSHHESSCPKAAPYKLHLHFIPKQVLAYFSDNHLALWQTPRPTLLVWIKTLHNDQQASYTSNASAEASLIKQVAQERGITVLLPTMDGQDQITPAPSQNGDTHLTKRYHTKHQLIGVLDPQTQSTRWTLLLPQTSLSWQQHDTAHPKSAIKQGVNHAIDAMGNRYATFQNNLPNDQVVFAIDAIHSLHDVHALLDYFKSIPMVKQAQLVHLDSHHIECALTLKGHKQALDQKLAQDKKLLLDPTTLTHNQITYTWQTHDPTSH